jgi:hypothetical protein
VTVTSLGRRPGPCPRSEVVTRSISSRNAYQAWIGRAHLFSTLEDQSRTGSFSVPIGYP